MKKKKVAIIGSVGLPANYGGFETLVNYLTINLNSKFNLTVYCQKTKKKDRLNNFNNCELKYIPFKANGGQSIIYDIISITKSWFKFDTLLILGTPGCIILPILNIFKKTRTVINFGGLEWKRNKWNIFARLYLKVSESIAINYATIIIADNQHFCDYIKYEYNKESKLIEYGGDHTSFSKKTTELLTKYPFLSNDYDLSISRAQPDNNLHIVLEAYKEIKDRSLVLISNYDRFDYGIELKKKFKNHTNLILLDAIYDLNELDTIRSNAKLYIHSHSFCGTAPSLVEAMSLKLPIIAYKTETNLFSTENQALYFNNETELKEIIENLKPDIINSNKGKMTEIAYRRYKWDRISNLYADNF